jgi:transposase
MEVTRIVKLALYANPGKLEGAKYTHGRHLKFTQHWVTQLFFNRAVKSFSTAGMGQLANQAQHKAQGILKAHFESVKETGAKSNVPQMRQIGCPAKLEKSENSSFDYWLSVENTFEKCKKIHVPVKGHKRLTYWLSRGYTLNSNAELHKDKNGKFYAIAFLQKEVKKAEPKPQTLGIDVGIRNSVTRSDGHFGKSLHVALVKARSKRAEKQRQGQRTRLEKTHIKQLLDREAKKAVHVASKSRWNLAVENPKVLANLKPRGRIAMWAKAYFAERCELLSQEFEVFYWTVNPAYTSQTCGNCHRYSKGSRDGRSFKCPYCRLTVNADLNGGLSIAHEGALGMSRLAKSRSGRVNSVPVCCPGWAA